MPSMQLDKIYIKDAYGGPRTYAKVDIERGTNLGPAFMVKSKTGDPKIDFVRTQLGKYLHQNPFFYNLRLVQKQYKFYAIALENIKKGEELVLNKLPWMEE